MRWNTPYRAQSSQPPPELPPRSPSAYTDRLNTTPPVMGSDTPQRSQTWQMNRPQSTSFVPPVPNRPKSAYAPSSHTPNNPNHTPSTDQGYSQSQLDSTLHDVQNGIGNLNVQYTSSVPTIPAPSPLPPFRRQLSNPINTAPGRQRQSQVFSNYSPSTHTQTPQQYNHHYGYPHSDIPLPPRDSSLSATILGMVGPSHQNIPSSSSVSSVSAGTATAPPITFPLPTAESLAITALSLETLPDSDKLAWAQDVLRQLDRHLHPGGQLTDFCAGSQSPINAIPDHLTALINDAIPIIISFTTHSNEALAALATYLKAKLLASGECPEFLPKDPRQAFKDFEASARAGEFRGWFRLGRDYEGVGDLGRAKDCFERGAKKGDCECSYRLGMAHLLGQLRLKPDPSTALPLLKAASSSSSVDAPHPSYVYGMLLASELLLPPSLPPIAPSLLLPPDTTLPGLYDQHALARESIERAAYFCHAPAQYKMGYLYEHASLTLNYDPLMSVQWYSLASQGGETEADMALSKWFLCGAEPHFGKNEELARVFAEKAARKGLPNGCFAMGYYYELGIGGRKDPDQARKWYQRAAKLGNPDAISRLTALSAPNPQTFSLQEHQSRLNDTLVRKRTAAKVRSDNAGGGRQRRRGDMERAKVDADRAARMAAGYGGERPLSAVQSPAPPPDQAWIPRQGSPFSHPKSPAPRVGEIMSPGVFHNAVIPSANSFSRRPTPHHALSDSSGGGTASIGSGGYPGPQGHRTSVSLHDDGPVGSPIPTQGEDTSWRMREQIERERLAKLDKGPQTFAEMGFVSKPVEDEGCCIM